MQQARSWHVGSFKPVVFVGAVLYALERMQSELFFQWAFIGPPAGSLGQKCLSGARPCCVRPVQVPAPCCFFFHFALVIPPCGTLSPFFKGTKSTIYILHVGAWFNIYKAENAYIYLKTVMRWFRAVCWSYHLVQRFYIYIPLGFFSHLLVITEKFKKRLTLFVVVVIVIASTLAFI